MQREIPLPYSHESFRVETERVATLFDLPIVRVSVFGRRIALTPLVATALGNALIEAGDEMGVGKQ